MVKSLNNKWTTKVPSTEGLYWCRWKGRYGWRITPAQVTLIGEGRLVSISGAGIALPIHKNVSEREAKRIFGFSEIKFHTSPLIVPVYSATKKGKKSEKR